MRIGNCDYSVDPAAIGRFVDVVASLDRVQVTCEGRLVADHARCWARAVTVTDPAHVAAAERLRFAWQDAQRDRARDSQRHPGQGHPVSLRALPDYDALFGVDFTAPIRGEVTR